jgi:DNA-binding MarR family transcriptional regulator
MSENPYEQINEVLLRFFRQHYSRIHSLFEQIGVYRGQPPILRQLSKEEGVPQSALAKCQHLAPATVTKMLQRMEQAGLIERRPDPTDQRITRVYLTQPGRDIQDSIRQRERQVTEEMLLGFSPQEKEQLAQYLVRMQENLLEVNSRLNG